MFMLISLLQRHVTSFIEKTLIVIVNAITCSKWLRHSTSMLSLLIPFDFVFK
jgi:hypothetical protein